MEYLEKLIEQIKLEMGQTALTKESLANNFDITEEGVKALDEMCIRDRDNNKQLEEFAKKSKKGKEEQRSFGDTIRDVAGYIGVSASPAVEAFAEKFDAVDENVGKAVLTVGTMITTLGSLTLKSAEHAKEITNVSQTMGMTTDPVSYTHLDVYKRQETR